MSFILYHSSKSLSLSWIPWVSIILCSLYRMMMMLSYYTTGARWKMMNFMFSHKQTTSKSDNELNIMPGGEKREKDLIISTFFCTGQLWWTDRMSSQMHWTKEERELLFIAKTKTIKKKDELNEKEKNHSRLMRWSLHCQSRTKFRQNHKT